MVDDPSDTAGPAAETGRPKRSPPTIDLEPTSSETHPAPAEAVAEGSSDAASEAHPHGAPEPELEAAEPAGVETPADEAIAASEPPPRAARPISPWIIAPFSGAVAAALVIGVGWMLGWPEVTAPTASPQLSSVVDDLSGRVKSLEGRIGKPDSALAGRIDALDKAVASVRNDVTALRAQSDKTAAAIGDLKAPREGAAAVDLSGLTARIDQLERASRNQSAALAQASGKIAEAKPTDDMPLRRVVAAALLDVAVRHGDPYAAALATAKSFAPNADALKPLEPFAKTGVPSPPALARDLLTIVPTLAPQQPETAPTGTSIVDRLQAGAAKLVRIERSDATGNDRGAVVARITAAAVRNDVADARRELELLPEADRTPAQAWLDKVNARDAALAASRHFADDAMTALATPPAKAGQ
ncbi:MULTISPECIES: hypothetical protein [unclassified Bradyrhizobium]|uniref:COG4223 family protein n=1 Tax=unclassified Bradyrhizobium TaxID=2631580 RepID=UPI002916AA03|nr:MULTISPECIES: hypothetical protein [unclassified Bradyrhizobium]